MIHHGCFWGQRDALVWFQPGDNTRTRSFSIIYCELGYFLPNVTKSCHMAIVFVSIVFLLRTDSTGRSCLMCRHKQSNMPHSAVLRLRRNFQCLVSLNENRVIAHRAVSDNPLIVDRYSCYCPARSASSLTTSSNNNVLETCPAPDPSAPLA